MKTPYLVLLVIIFSGIFFASCKEDTSSGSARAKEKQDDALKDLEKSFQSLSEGNSEVVDFRILKDALPEKLIGMDRVSHNGQKSGIGGIKISSAEATYQDGDKKLAINIIDTGGFGAALAGMAAWTQLEIDNETNDGYERTTMIDDKKAIEKYNRTTGDGEISVISADRFIVTISGSNISEDDMRTAVKKIKIKS